jgi:NAD(P)-dependent dehydrogenase (short-subunit alcohol dehydrogenase family)
MTSNPQSKGRMQGKVCLVTGAASGIGEAIATRFIEEGARVALLDSNVTLLEQVVARLESQAPGSALALPADVRDEQAVADGLATTLGTFGPLHSAVNCAGILGPVGPLHSLASAEIDELLAVNLGGVVRCMQHELIAMLDSGTGSIVNISSAAGLVGFPTAAAYTAAKHAVVGLTRTCAIDYAAHNIRVNAIAPGGIDTPLIRATTCATPEGKAMIEGLHPMKRLGNAGEVASAALFLSSDEASFVTGTTFCVDGGWVA